MVKELLGPVMREFAADDSDEKETKKELFSQNTFPSEVVYGIKPG